jgi:parallel beta-helix repeat protein
MVYTPKTHVTEDVWTADIANDLEQGLAAADVVYNAKAHGVAEGNSAAVNTTAMNALHVAASSVGAQILLPAGAYSFNTLSLRAPMRGDNRRSTVMNCGQITVSIANVELSTLKIVSTAATAIVASNLDDVTLRDVHIDWNASVTTAHLALDAYNVDRLRVLGSRFRIGGVQLSQCQDFVVDGNYWDCEYLNTNEPCHISGASSGIFVNNNVYRTATDGLDLFNAGHYCVVANNRFVGLRGAAGIECKVTMSDDVNNTSSPGFTVEGTIIANNVLKDFSPPATSTRTGIYAEYIDSRAAPAFSVAETHRGIVITGNTIQNANVTDPGGGIVANYWGIVYTGHNGLITNNTIRNFKSWNASAPVGIRLAQPSGSKCVGVRVAGNVIAGMDGAEAKGIETGSMDRCQIDDNIIRGDESTSLQTKIGISVVASATLHHCSISGNTLECNNSTGMGLRSLTGAVLNRCRIVGNILYNCGVAVTAMQYCMVSGNVLENATNSQTFSCGVASTSSRGNSFTGNHITMSSDYGFVLTDFDGFTLVGCTFNATNRAVLLVGGTRNGVLANNISITQSGGSEFPHYSGVSGGDQATITATDNKVL